MHIRPPSVFALVAATVVACSSPATDDTSSNATNLTLEPKDFDPLTQAKLTVTIPANIPYKYDPRLIMVVGAGVSGNNAGLTYGKPFVGRAGAWKVCFAESFGFLSATDECRDVPTTPGQTVEVDLGAIAVSATGPALPPAAVKPDFGPSAEAPRYRDGSYWVDGNPMTLTNGPSAARLVFAGTHTIQPGASTKRPITVAPGEVVNLALTDDVYMRPPEAFHLRVTFESATLPTVPDTALSVIGNANEDSSADWTLTWFGSSHYLSFASRTFSRSTDSTPVDLVGLVCPGCTAQLQQSGVLSVPFSMAGGTQTIALKRLDVDNVTVTPADSPSTPYKVSGTWTLTDANGNRLGDSFPTGYGVDVPPGRYHVVINYSTREKPNQTQSFDVTL